MRYLCVVVVLLHCCAAAQTLRDRCDLPVAVPRELRDHQQLPDGFQLEHESRAVLVARNRNGTWLIHDHHENRSVLYNWYSYFPRYRPANTSLLYYTVSCELLLQLPDFRCDTLRAIVRFGLAYALAWLNTVDMGETERRYPRITLRELPYETFLRRPTPNVTHIRLQDFLRPIASPHGTKYPKHDAESLLGQANLHSVDLSVHGVWYFDDLAENMADLRTLTPESIQRLLRPGLPYQRLPVERLRCSNSFMNVLTHELLHMLLLGHADHPDSNMFFAARGREHSTRNNRLGGLTILSNDVMMLRHRWGRSNHYLPLEFMRHGDYRDEFALLTADWQAQLHNDTPPSTTTTTTTTTTKPDPPDLLSDENFRDPAVIDRVDQLIRRLLQARLARMQEKIVKKLYGEPAAGKNERTRDYASRLLVSVLD